MISVVVVGAGIAGLTCAFRLQRAGCHVEVLEREDEPGGRHAGVVRRGFVLDQVAEHVTSRDRNLLGTVRALGIADRLLPVRAPRHAVLRAGKLHPMPHSVRAQLTSTLVSPATRLRFARFGLGLARSAGRSQRSTRGADAPASAGLRRAIGDEGLAWLSGPALRDAFGCEPDDVSWVMARRHLCDAEQGRPLAFHGGVRVLADTLAGRVPVRLGFEVTAVETETDGVRVHYRTRGTRDGEGNTRAGRVVADAVVVAVPGTRVVSLCPKLTPAECGFFDRVAYAPELSVALAFERAPRGAEFSAITLPRDRGLVARVDAEHHRAGYAPAGAGLLRVALGPDAVARLWEASDAAIVAAVLDELAALPLAAALLGGTSREVGRLAPSDAIVRRCPNARPRFAPGWPEELARFANRVQRSPRLAFAADYLEGPGLEAAVSSGMRAATEVVRRVPPGARAAAGSVIRNRASGSVASGSIAAGSPGRSSSPTSRADALGKDPYATLPGDAPRLSKLRFP